jgi:hypothetical protein
VAGLSRSPSSSWLLDPEVKEPVAFTDVTKMAECGLDNLLASLTPWSRIKRTVALILCWPARFRERKQRKAGIWKQEATASQPSPRITRFVVKKKGAAPREFEIEEPSPDELTLSVNRLVGRAQRIAYAPEFKVITRGIALESASPLTKVRPYIDDQGVLQVGGRIVNAPVPFDIRNPVVLPPKAMVSERIVRAIHIKDKNHTSPWRTLPEVQREYWITSPRRLIRRVVDLCTLCRRFAAKAASPLMAALPAARLQVFQPPVACTGVDYFGPIEVKLFRQEMGMSVYLPHHPSCPFGDGVRPGFGFFHLCLRELQSGAGYAKIHPLRQRNQLQRRPE